MSTRRLPSWNASPPNAKQRRGHSRGLAFFLCTFIAKVNYLAREIEKFIIHHFQFLLRVITPKHPTTAHHLAKFTSNMRAIHRLVLLAAACICAAHLVDAAKGKTKAVGAGDVAALVKGCVDRCPK